MAASVDKVVGMAKLWGKNSTVCAMRSLQVRKKNAVATVVLRIHANVPAVSAVQRPGAAFLRCFVQENFIARGCERCFIIVKGSVEESFSRELWVDPRGAQKIEICGGERNQVAPQMHGKVGMDTAHSGKKLIFERADGLFRRICAMGVGRDDLERNFVVTQVFFYGVGEFVVHDVHFRI